MGMKGMPVLFAMLLLPLSFAQLTTVQQSLSDLCIGLMQLLPVAAMLLVILSAVIYAAGQMMGAETRARANVWATAAVTGALMGILISVVAPSVLSTIVGQSVSCTATAFGTCGSNICPATQHCCGSTCCGNGNICSGGSCGIPSGCLGSNVASCNGGCYSTITQKCCWGQVYAIADLPPGC